MDFLSWYYGKSRETGVFISIFICTFGVFSVNAVGSHCRHPNRNRDGEYLVEKQNQLVFIIVNIAMNIA